METLLSKIATRITYIRNNSTNAYILKSLTVIETKIQEFKDRKYSTEEVVTSICNEIINRDIARMKGVSGETNMVYKKMDELAEFVSQIPEAYFKEN